MTLDRATVKAVVVAVVTIVVTALVIAWTVDDDERTRSTGGDPTSTAAGSTPSPSATAGTGGTDPQSGLPWVSEEELPAEARATLALIDEGGPFPYDQDGATFGNFEGLLPDRPRGYYHEYTVRTPGASTRGARRIVTGAVGEYYWTEDHYASFERIARRT